MAKLQAGILSNVRGAVAGVVGGVWKGKNYLRARVTPANPNSEAQQTQRGKMGAAVAFAKLILGGVLQPFVDPFQKVMSGFNWFVKKNISLFTVSPVYQSVIITEGTLYFGGIESLDYDTNTVSFAWDAANGSNGLATDKVLAVFRNAADGSVSILGTAIARSTDHGTMTVTGVTSSSHGTIWLFVYREVSGKITMVSNSDALTV